MTNMSNHGHKFGQISKTHWKNTDKNIDTWEAMVNGEWLVLSQIIVIDVLSLKMGGRGG